MMIKILVWIFGLLAIYNVFTKYQKKELSLNLLIFWILLWGAVIAAITISPEADKVAAYLGLGQGRGIELALFLAILLILFLIFRLYLNISRIETQISEIVKNIALTNVKRNKRKRRRKR